LIDRDIILLIDDKVVTKLDGNKKNTAKIIPYNNRKATLTLFYEG
jgi:hypothetical protein